jgi:hypothetical protein
MRLDGNGAPADRELRLYSAMGVLCAQDRVRLYPGSPSSLDIGHLPAATYLLELYAPDGHRLVKPFVKPQ